MEDLNRSIAYKLFSMAISYPEKEVAQAIETGWLFRQLNNVFENNGEILTLINLSADDFEDIEKLQVVYTTCFDLKISLYESNYVLKDAKPEEKGRFLFELEKFYLEAGVSLSDRDMPDYLPTQLEFMHYLCSENKVEEQKYFLKNHLITWIEHLIEKVDNEDVVFYCHILKAIENFLKLDFSRLIK
jgi:nitrate reductase molybdenum cofactor assembly chaperone